MVLLDLGTIQHAVQQENGRDNRRPPGQPRRNWKKELDVFSRLRSALSGAKQNQRSEAEADCNPKP
jgi:hypothetical protein